MRDLANLFTLFNKKLYPAYDLWLKCFSDRDHSFPRAVNEHFAIGREQHLTSFSLLLVFVVTEHFACT